MPGARREKGNQVFDKLLVPWFTTYMSNPTATLYLLLDNLTGQFLPGEYTWEAAKASDTPCTTIVRKDEAELGWIK